VTISEAQNVFRTLPPVTGLMRAADAAALAGLNPETVHRRVRRGQVPAWDNPRRVRLVDLLVVYELRKRAGSAEK
jgi:hypothetical protein